MITRKNKIELVGTYGWREDHKFSVNAYYNMVPERSYMFQSHTNGSKTYIER